VTTFLDHASHLPNDPSVDTLVGTPVPSESAIPRDSAAATPADTDLAAIGGDPTPATYWRPRESERGAYTEKKLGDSLLAIWETSEMPAGADITQVVGIMHGFLYMIFLVVGADLSRRARFPVWFAVITLVLGTIPFLSFVGEHNATKRVRAEHPDLAPARAPAR